MSGYRNYPGTELEGVLREHQQHTEAMLGLDIDTVFDEVGRWTSDVSQPGSDRQNKDAEDAPQSVTVPRSEIFQAIDPKYQMETMRTVADLVQEVELPHMRSGFLGYLAVTKKVYSETLKKNFEDSDKFLIEVPVFAGLAYNALLKHIEGDRKGIPKHWKAPMYSGLAQNAGPGASMWHFWRGHIPDLPKVLLLTGTSSEDDKHKKDFEKIDDVLHDSVESVMHAISLEPTRFCRFAAEIALKDVYLLRRRQWDKFVELQAKNMPSDTVRAEIIDGPTPYEPFRVVAQLGGDVVMRAHAATFLSSAERVAA